MTNIMNFNDDRPIGASGHYDLSVIPDDEFEVYNDFNEVELAAPDNH